MRRDNWSPGRVGGAACRWKYNLIRRVGLPRVGGHHPWAMRPNEAHEEAKGLHVAVCARGGALAARGNKIERDHCVGR